jgi:hypothetical protein
MLDKGGTTVFVPCATVIDNELAAAAAAAAARGGMARAVFGVSREYTQRVKRLGRTRNARVIASPNVVQWSTIVDLCDSTPRHRLVSSTSFDNDIHHHRRR